MSSSKSELHCYVYYEDVEGGKRARSKPKHSKLAGHGGENGCPLTDLVPHHFIKFKEGKPFSPKHDNDFDQNLTYLCKWKEQVSPENGYETDPEKDYYEVKIVKMAQSLQQLNKWVTNNVNEVKLVQTATASKTRTTRNPQPRAMYSAPVAGPSKSSALKASVTSQQKVSADEEKEKKMEIQNAKLRSQANSLKMKKSNAVDQPINDESDYDPTGDEAIKSEIKRLRSERDKWEKRARDSEKRADVLEKENQTLFNENTMQRKEFVVISANFTKLSARLLETQESRPAYSSLSAGSDIKEQTRNLLKASPERNSSLNKVKVEQMEEVATKMEWKAVVIDIPDRNDATLKTAVKSNQLRPDPEEPNDNTGMAVDGDSNEIEEHPESNEFPKTKSHVAPSGSDELNNYPEQLSPPSSPPVQSPTTSGKPEGKQDAEVQKLWRPDHPIEQCKKSSDGLMVNLGNDVWIEEPAWHGIKTNKDVSVFVKDLAFTMYQDGIANRSYKGRPSNSKPSEPAKLAISPAKKELLVGYYIEKVKLTGDLGKIQKTLKDGSVIIDEGEVNKKLSQYVSEKSAYITRKLKRKVVDGKNSDEKGGKKTKNKNEDK